MTAVASKLTQANVDQAYEYAADLFGFELTESVRDFMCQVLVCTRQELDPILDADVNNPDA